jgi:formylglycine-generating enzyme
MKMSWLVIRVSGLSVFVAMVLCTCNPLSEIIGTPELILKAWGNAIGVGDSYYFGELTADTGTAEVGFVIENTGLSDLQLPHGVRLEGAGGSGFRIARQPPEVIGPNEQAGFAIVFEPEGDEGERQASVAIESNVVYLNTHFTFLVSGMIVSIGNTDTAARPSALPPQMMNVPAGSFEMGSVGIAEPVHTVTLSAFRIGQFEVTYHLWYEVRTWAEANGYWFFNLGNEGRSGVDGIAPEAEELPPAYGISPYDMIVWSNALSEMSGLEPIYYKTLEYTSENVHRSSAPSAGIESISVKWDADGYRLPTEAEWEYAARYIDGVSFTPGYLPSGASEIGQEDTYSWYYGNSGEITHPVGQKAPNALGLFDMSGNLMETCWDRFGEYFGSAQTDPHGPTSGTDGVRRGGDFFMGADHLRVAFRQANELWGRITTFRLARTGH